MQEATAPSVTAAEMPAVDAVTAVQSLTANLNSMKEQEAALRAQLAELSEQAVAGAVVQTLALISSVGSTPEKFAALLLPKKGRKAKGTGERRQAPVVTWVMKTDPTKRYVRGVQPGWLQAAITAAGGNPADKKDRDSFKAQYMEAVSA